MVLNSQKGDNPMKINNKGSVKLPDGVVAICSAKLFSVIMEELAIVNDKAKEILDSLLENTLFLDMHGKNIEVNIDELISVTEDGSTFVVPVIGLESHRHKRFLDKNEKTINEFTNEHRFAKTGIYAGSEKSATVLREYKDYVMKKVTRHNPELDTALGID